MPTEKSCNDLEHFVQLVLADRDLLEKLRATADLESFAALAVRSGQDRGCDFTAEDVRSAVQERRRVWLERGIQNE